MDFLDLVFPKRCVGCGKWGKYVCSGCEVGLWEEEQICPSCRRNSRYGERHKYCQGDLEGLTCLWAYEGMARKLISNAKYKYYFDYLGELVGWSMGQLDSRFELAKFLEFMSLKPIVVPVPMHLKKLRERGFNQAEVISKLIARGWTLDVGNILVKERETGEKEGKFREERPDSLKGAFSLKSNIKKVGPVLLVDDVWTTGAVMSECARILRRAGVERVWGLVLAR